MRLCRRLWHEETDADDQHQGRDPDHSFPRAFPSRLPKKSVVPLILGGAALQRCDKRPGFNRGSPAECTSGKKFEFFSSLLVAALIARYPFAVAAARSPLLFRPNP